MPPCVLYPLKVNPLTLLSVLVILKTASQTFQHFLRIALKILVLKLLTKYVLTLHFTLHYLQA